VTTVQLTAAAAGAAVGGAVANVAGLVDPGGAAGAQDAARWLYIVMLAAPVVAFVCVRVYAGREARATRELTDVAEALATA
jgi:hypothetical protein